MKMFTTENTEDTEVLNNEIIAAIIGSAICLPKELGPGLLESVYERCFAYELSQREHLVEVRKNPNRVDERC
jgi:GxxExxY protein